MQMHMYTLISCPKENIFKEWKSLIITCKICAWWYKYLRNSVISFFSLHLHRKRLIKIIHDQCEHKNIDNEVLVIRNAVQDVQTAKL